MRKDFLKRREWCCKYCTQYAGSKSDRQAMRDRDGFCSSRCKVAAQLEGLQTQQEKPQ